MFALAGLASLGGSFCDARAEQLTLQAVQDNTLFEDSTGSLSNGAGPALFVGKNSLENARRALLRFDVDLPAGATVTSATLRLHVSNAPNTIPQTVSVHRLLGAWGEGASHTSGGRGAEAQAGDATWLHRFHPDSLWAAPGGDFAPSPSARVSLGDVGAYTFAGAGMVADVQRWVNAPQSNFGWLLQGNESEPSTARRIDSREVEVETDRPTLIIEFTTTSALQRATWGQVKHRFGRRRNP